MYIYIICMRDSVGHAWGRRYRQSRFQREIGEGTRQERWSATLLLYHFVSPMNPIPRRRGLTYSFTTYFLLTYLLSTILLFVSASAFCLFKQHKVLILYKKNSLQHKTVHFPSLTFNNRPLNQGLQKWQPAVSCPPSGVQKFGHLGDVQSKFGSKGLVFTSYGDAPFCFSAGTTDLFSILLSSLTTSYME